MKLLFAALFCLFLSCGHCYFVENRGHIYDYDGVQRNDVHFYHVTNNMTIFFTDKGVVYYFQDIRPSQMDSIESGMIQNPYTHEEWEKIMFDYSNGKRIPVNVQQDFKGYRVDLEIVGANLQKCIGINPSVGITDFYHPNFNEGILGVQDFEQIKYKEVYEGVDLIFYFKDGILKYDFEVAPFADYKQIKLLYNGSDELVLDEEGNLLIKTFAGDFIENRPVSFSQDREINSSFLLSGDTISFNVSNYNRSHVLTIDPVVTWKTFFHSNASGSSFTVSHPVFDSQDNMYVALSTYNRTTFPTIDPGGGAYFTSTGGGNGLQLVIQKFNAQRQIVWSTYYASSQTTRISYAGDVIAVDQSDNIIVVGMMDFPFAGTNTFPHFNGGGGAYYNNQVGNNRAFILRFSPSGQCLHATTFNSIGTNSSGLSIQSVKVDAANNIVMAGYAYTPTSSWHAVPTANPGGSHYFNNSPVETLTPTLFRFTNNLQLNWGTYLSRGQAATFNGSGEPGTVMTIDNSGNIVIATQIDIRPESPSWGPAGSATGWAVVNPGGGAYIDASTISTHNNSRKTGILEFNSSGALVWSTLFGGNTVSGTGYTGTNAWNDPGAIGRNSHGELYVVGHSSTTNFPTVNPGGGAYFQGTRSTSSSSWARDAYIVKFNSNRQMEWSTYYGTNSSGEGTTFKGIGIDGQDNVFISGWAQLNSPLPSQVLAGSYFHASNPERAVALLKFSRENQRLWATEIGRDTWCSNTGGGFALNNSGGACSGSKLVMWAAAQNTFYGALTMVNPGGGAYFNASPEGLGTSSDFIMELTDAEIPTTHALNNDEKTCPCSGNNFTHFIHPGTERLIMSINPNGQNLGDVTAYAYVQTPSIPIDECQSPNNPLYQTAAMGRRFKATAQHPPTAPVTVRLYFDNSEFNALVSASQANANPFDDVNSLSDLFVTKFSASSNPHIYENHLFTDNCGNGAISLHTQQNSGVSSALIGGFNGASRYIEFQVSSFSEFWLHGTSGNSALPVELIDFNVYCENSLHRVQWSTASEVNNDFFALERSVNGNDWQQVDRITGMGTINELTEYAVDINPVNTLTYYRIKQTDFDGSSTIFGPIAVNCEVQKLQIYPNPSNDLFYVLAPNDKRIENIKVIDAAGNLILGDNGNNQVKLIISSANWNNGVYFVQSSFTDGSMEVGKIVIHH
jgi:hypothetical protein